MLRVQVSLHPPNMEDEPGGCQARFAKPEVRVSRIAFDWYFFRQIPCLTFQGETTGLISQEAKKPSSILGDTTR